MLHKSLDAARVCGELHFYAVISIISCSQALLNLAIGLVRCYVNKYLLSKKKLHTNQGADDRQEKIKGNSSIFIVSIIYYDKYYKFYEYHNNLC